MTTDRDTNLVALRDITEQTAQLLGVELRTMRVSADLSLRRLSERCGVRLDVLQRAERGRWVLTSDELASVLAAVNDQPS